MAALPLLGLPVAADGRPFLLVMPILAAAVLFGRAAALVAAVTATAAMAPFMQAPDAAMRAGLSLLSFLVVGFGFAAAAEAMRSVFALMDVADGRRAAGVVAPERERVRPAGLSPRP
ncbi:hypothetical protein [Falsiroseomonas sp. HW251]|uniref:hypothetical protein n=1 Tax=Falsiroseomonas sp. HW251 TaxID=3390998 RepID=UPI003D31BCD1